MIIPNFEKSLILRQIIKVTVTNQMTWKNCTMSIVMISANYLKELLHLTSAFMTMLIVQFFQVIWFVTVSVIMCLKISDFSKFGMIVWSFIPGSILLSLVSPFLFWILGNIWRVPSDSGPRGVEI
jgi:hypothetical protein